MTRAGRLDALIAGLRGHPPAGADWLAIIELANHTLLTPAVHAALLRSGRSAELPQDVRDYLGFLHDCNRIRNLAMRAQLRDIVACLNQSGVIPILLKGAVPLFVAEEDELAERLTSDLDVGVEALDAVAARRALLAAGYVEAPQSREMVLPEGGATLDLRPFHSGGPGVPEAVARGGVVARIPSVEARALHWTLHDLVKEGDYWRGRIDLRHLYDLARLHEREGVDWALVRAAAPGWIARDAVDTQLLALRHFFDVPVPAECSGSRLARAQHWRRVFSATHPVAGAPLRAAGHLAWWGWRLSNLAEIARRGPRDLARRMTRALSESRSKI
jgi:hypothetical protein